MKQDSTQKNKTSSFSDNLIGDYYINTIDSIINNDEEDLQRVNDIEEFVSSICSKEKKKQFNGSFDEYFSQIK